MWEHVQVEARGCYWVYSGTGPLRTSSLTEPRVHPLAVLAGQQAAGICLCLPLLLWGYRHRIQPSAFELLSCLGSAHSKPCIGCDFSPTLEMLIIITCVVLWMQAEKTHFRDRSLKWKLYFLCSERWPVQCLKLVNIRRLYNTFTGWEHKARGSGLGCCIDQSYFDTKG